MLRNSAGWRKQSSTGLYMQSPVTGSSSLTSVQRCSNYSQLTTRRKGLQNSYIHNRFFLSVSVNGVWGLWSPYSSCPVTCGVGLQKSSRKCDKPAPKYGGRSCPGTRHQTKICSTKVHCPGKQGFRVSESHLSGVWLILIVWHRSAVTSNYLHTYIIGMNFLVMKWNLY